MTYKKKLTRKEFLNQPDEFVTLSARVITFARERTNIMLLGAGGIALISILTVAHFAYHGHRRSEANRLEMEALRAYQGAALPATDTATTTQEGDYKTAREKFQELLDKYQEGKHSRRALLYLANCAYREGDYNKAEDLFHQYLAEYSHHRDLWYREALWGLAYAQESAGKYTNAADSYNKAIATIEAPEAKQPLYLDLARAYKLAGQWKKAAEIYETMLESTSDEQQKKSLEAKLKETKTKLGPS